METFLDFVFTFLAWLPQAAEVAGWALVIGALIDITKLFTDKIDGWSGKIALIANALLLGVLWFADRYGFRAQFEEVVAQLGVALPAMVALFAALGGAKLAHWVMKQVDLVAFSLSARREAASIQQWQAKNKLAQRDDADRELAEIARDLIR